MVSNLHELTAVFPQCQLPARSKSPIRRLNKPSALTMQDSAAPCACRLAPLPMRTAELEFPPACLDNPWSRAYAAVRAFLKGLKRRQRASSSCARGCGIKYLCTLCGATARSEQGGRAVQPENERTVI